MSKPKKKKRKKPHSTLKTKNETRNYSRTLSRQKSGQQEYTNPYSKVTEPSEDFLTGFEKKFDEKIEKELRTQKKSWKLKVTDYVIENHLKIIGLLLAFFGAIAWIAAPLVSTVFRAKSNASEINKIYGYVNDNSKQVKLNLNDIIRLQENVKTINQSVDTKYQEFDTLGSPAKKQIPLLDSSVNQTN